MSLPPRRFTKVDVRTAVPKQHLRLWHFDHPNLYHVSTRVTATGDAAPLHAKTDRFGIRKVEVRPDGLYLNGERVRLNGFNRVHEHRALGNTEPDHLVKSDVDLMKRYGCNLTRLMHAPLATNLLDYLDEQGVMIFEEIPLWGGEDPRMQPNDRLAFQWLREMIDRDYNHPCIIGWSVGNELLQHKDYVTSAYDYVRAELDPHRLLSYVSHSGHKATYNASNDPLSQSDIALHNCYKAWYPRPSITTKTIRGKWPALPIFYTEYGTKTFGDALDAIVPSLDEWYHDLAGHPYVIGTSLWTFADYRSRWRGTLPSENRGWGMFDVWRRPKAAVAQVDALYSPVRSLTVQGDQIRLEPRTWDEIPAFTLHDYWLKWEWLRPDGAVAGGGVVRLPKIEPGGATLSTPTGAAPAGEAELVVSLITPTGHVVREERQRPTKVSAAVAPAKAVRAAAARTSEIAKAYPIDGGFFLGYRNEKNDQGVIVEYGTTSGQYAERLTANLRGAIAVRGLENGRRYFARLKRIPATGDADWSDEVSVTPDGGLKPAAPALYGVVRGDGVAAVRFQPIEKATGYVVRYGDRSFRVNTAAVGTAVVTGLEDASAYTFTVAALNAVGESAASNPVVAAPRVVNPN